MELKEKYASFFLSENLWERGWDDAKAYKIHKKYLFKTCDRRDFDCEWTWTVR